MIRRENNASTTARDERLHMLTNADEAGHAQQQILVPHIGSHLDPGIRRKYRPNEDTLLVTQGVMPSASPSTTSTPFVLLVVADGMGGQGHGRTASRLAVQSLVEYMSVSLCLRQRSPESLLFLLSAGVQHANHVVYESNQQQQTVMGTTMTSALIIETTVYAAHVGDSRLYLYRASAGLAQITRDHSVVAALVTAGIIEPDDIYTHPHRNQIYRSLGENATVEVDTAAVPLSAGDILLVCSDGLWEMVRDRQSAAILTTPMPTPQIRPMRLFKQHWLVEGKTMLAPLWQW